MANLSNINNKLLVGTNGEVRIGDTATIANVKLRVKQTAQQWIAQFVNTDSSVAYGISIDTSASSYGVAGTLQCYTNSGGGFIVRNDSKVGIGVTDPQARLEVKGISATPADGNEVIAVTNTTGGSKLLLGVAENAYGWIQSAEGGTLRNLLLNPNGGNVGIGGGTTSPTDKLEVVGSGGNTNIRVYDSSSNSEVGLKLQNDAKTWTLQNWGSGGDNLRLLNNAGNIVQLWDDNGKVAIGNFNDPDRTLDVRGDGMSIYGTGDYTELMLRGQVEGTGTVRSVGAWHWSIRGDVGGDNDDLKLLRFIFFK